MCQAVLGQHLIYCYIMHHFIAFCFCRCVKQSLVNTWSIATLCIISLPFVFVHMSSSPWSTVSLLIHCASFHCLLFLSVCQAVLVQNFVYHYSMQYFIAFCFCPCVKQYLVNTLCIATVCNISLPFVFVYVSSSPWSTLSLLLHNASLHCLLFLSVCQAFLG